MQYLRARDIAASVPTRRFYEEPYVAYLYNGPLMVEGKIGPSAGSAIADCKATSVKKALSEMVDRRALMVNASVPSTVDLPTWDIVTGERSSLPAQFLTYHGSLPNPVDTTGTAAHPNSSGAIVSAVLELIEKNAMFLWWYGLEGVRLPAEIFAANRYCRLFARSGLNVNAYAITTFHPLVAVFVVAHSALTNVLLVGRGVDVGLGSATEHAFQEAFLLGWARVSERLDPVARSQWLTVDDEVTQRIRHLATKRVAYMPYTESTIFREDQYLVTIRRALPSWVSSLHIAMLRQDALPLRCVKAFSYELYNHRVAGKYITSDRRINQMTLNLSDRQMEAVPPCPLT